MAKFDGNGDRINTDAILNSDRNNDQINPKIEFLENGELLVIWESDTSGSSSSDSIVGVKIPCPEHKFMLTNGTCVDECEDPF